ncbi:MAG: hypothetical protein HYV60_06865 [Planctomycetia bacterium]|nr:hypothetical protein [Planctomycetia bacterium]
MAINERREMRFLGAIAVDHVRPILEITDPQGIGLIAGPAATDLLLGNAQLQPCRSHFFQMPVERGFGKRGFEFLLQKLVDRFLGASRLILLQLDRFVDDLLLDATWLAAVAAPLPEQRFEASFAIQLPLPPKGRPTGRLALPIGKQLFLLEQCGTDKLLVPKSEREDSR